MASKTWTKPTLPTPNQRRHTRAQGKRAAQFPPAQPASSRLHVQARPTDPPDEYRERIIRGQKVRVPFWRYRKPPEPTQTVPEPKILFNLRQGNLQDGRRHDGR